MEEQAWLIVGDEDGKATGAHVPATGPERRVHARMTIVQPAKVFDRRAERYFPGQTSNISDGGALIVLNRTMPIHAGDRLEVGVNKSLGRVILRQTELTPARVVRVTPIDRFSQAVAVQFDSSERQASTARRAA